MRCLAIFAAWLCVVLSSSCDGSGRGSKSLLVAVASNQSIAMQEVIEAWQEETGYQAELVTGSSGKLTAQILSGAPYDIFVAAHPKYADTLSRSDMLSGTPQTIGYGQLALIWQADTSTLSVTRRLNAARHIAIANPEIAPYGLAATYYFDSHFMLDRLKPRLVYAENVAQVHQYVSTGAADVGLTALSLMIKQQPDKNVQWTRLSKGYPLVEQTLCLIKSQGAGKMAASFAEFIGSEEGKGILASYGFLQAN